MKFSTFEGSKPEISVSSVTFDLCSTDGLTNIKVNRAYTVPSLTIQSQTLDVDSAKRAWPYLNKLPLPEVNPKEVCILIGMDIPQAHTELDVRRATPASSGPVATLTPFGWCVAGPINLPRKRKAVSHHFHSLVAEESLSLQVEKFWDTDAMGTHPIAPAPQSADDEKALNILKSTIRCVDHRYTVGLMWRDKDPALPDNRLSALKRLYSVESRFKRDPAFAKRYQNVVEEYITLGHARLVTSLELANSPPWTWYLPHHGVVNPNKPKKVRVVFDGSAEFLGTSLKKSLLKGPDLLTSLLGVLLRFRLRPIPLSADIEKMYHQVKVREVDQPALRFFWRPPESSSSPLTYQMTVHVFGAVSSPTTCLFALRQTAEDNHATFPVVADLVVTNFYVDNYLDSVDTEEEAINRTKQLTDLLLLGGFRLTKWLSSSRAVLSSLDTEELMTPNLDLDLDNLPVERTLGILWNCQSDSFNFMINVKQDTTTKRKILSEVSRVFDPLGFLHR